MVDRLPPHNIDAEEALLGSLILDESYLDQMTLSSQDFYSERNGWIFEACRSLHDGKISVNQITIAHKLAAGEKLEKCGGAAFLSHLITSTPTSLDCLYYAQIVQKLALKRKLIDLSDSVANMGYSIDGEIESDVVKIDSLLDTFRQGLKTDKIVTPAMRAEQAMEHYNNLQYKSGGAAIPTGLYDLDEQLGGGFYPGDFALIAGRGGIGKTTLGKTMSNNIGESGKIVAHFSCEMPTQSLTDRDVAGYLEVPIDAVRYGDYDRNNPGLFESIMRSMQYIADTQVYHIDGVIDTGRVRHDSKIIQKKYGLDAIVVDYLGILTDRYGQNEQSRISYISRTLKNIAIELNVPLIALCQLSREPEKRDNKRPQLSDLRDSGALEQDADIVLLVYRENYYDPSKNNPTEIILAKKRQGEANKIIPVFYNKARGRICNLTKQEGMI